VHLRQPGGQGRGEAQMRRVRHREQSAGGAQDHPPRRGRSRLVLPQVRQEWPAPLPTLLPILCLLRRFAAGHAARGAGGGPAACARARARARTCQSHWPRAREDRADADNHGEVPLAKLVAALELPALHAAERRRSLGVRHVRTRPPAGPLRVRARVPLGCALGRDLSPNRAVAAAGTSCTLRARCRRH
jgi:hypothetical protein